MRQLRQKHEDPLDLGSLPLVAPPRDGWPAVEAALRADHRHRSLSRTVAGSLALAATLALALGVAWWGSRAADTSATGDRPAVAAASPSGPGSAAASAGSPQALDTLIGLSQGLEARLRLIRAETGDLPADSLVYRVELEDLVVQVDEQLSRSPNSLALWTQRVKLLMDLERVYANSLRRDYQRMASL